ncbi:GntR family transcriptional regulator [Pseudooceanicola sp. MF1-13]|uniref:GntR family transcriptional regulator n=1 Tax=Pseudooceanicola sp. MF1-13 TaxID=3379095 RepID=UPI0038918122
MKQDSPPEFGSTESGSMRMYEVYHRLREDIISGRLPAGRKLRIETLKAEYGTGASPLREALSLLIPEGFVDRLENRGFRVSNVSREEFEDLNGMRCWMEGRALRSSIQRGGKDWEGKIVLALYWFSQAFPTHEDTREQAFERRRLHKEFHMALISECDSPILLHLCDQLHDKNARYRSLVDYCVPSERNYLEEHEMIVEAALRRDGDAAVDLLVQHYGRSGEQITAALKGDPPKSDGCESAA